MKKGYKIFWNFHVQIRAKRVPTVSFIYFPYIYMYVCILIVEKSGLRCICERKICDRKAKWRKIDVKYLRRVHCPCFSIADRSFKCLSFFFFIVVIIVVIILFSTQFNYFFSIFFFFLHTNKKLMT